MSGEDRDESAVLPREWERLERSAEEASATLGQWIRRARNAETEVERLRHALEEGGDERGESGDLAESLKQARAENAALESRMLQARKRVVRLMQRLSALEVDG